MKQVEDSRPNLTCKLSPNKASTILVPNRGPTSSGLLTQIGRRQSGRSNEDDSAIVLCHDEGCVSLAEKTRLVPVLSQPRCSAACFVPVRPRTHISTLQHHPARALPRLSTLRFASIPCDRDELLSLSTAVGQLPALMRQTVLRGRLLPSALASGDHLRCHWD